MTGVERVQPRVGGVKRLSLLFWGGSGILAMFGFNEHVVCECHKDTSASVCEPRRSSVRQTAQSYRLFWEIGDLMEGLLLGR